MIPLSAGEAEHIVAQVARPHNFIIKKIILDKLSKYDFIY